MARPKLSDDTKRRALELKAEGASGATIAKTLKISEGAVSGILSEAREASNAATPASPPEPAAPPPAPANALADEATAAIGELAEADALHERLRRRLLLLGTRVDDELRKPQPDWALVQRLLAAERQVRDEVIRTRPPRVIKAEDDPAHLEAARVVVASLRARVEAGRRARGLVA